MTGRLFDDGYPDPIVLRSMGADKRRTLRQRELIRLGVHPLTKEKLRESGPTCGDCVHAKKVRGGARQYWKCDTIPVTGGPGTDLRISWPACVRFES